MIYEKPRMEILKFKEKKDVICASADGYHDIDNPPDYSDQEGNDW